MHLDTLGDLIEKLTEVDLAEVEPYLNGFGFSDEEVRQIAARAAKCRGRHDAKARILDTIVELRNIRMLRGQPLE